MSDGRPVSQGVCPSLINATEQRLILEHKAEKHLGNLKHISLKGTLSRDFQPKIFYKAVSSFGHDNPISSNAGGKLSKIVFVTRVN